ncbi:hypothetical protein SAMN06265795_110117 [Noviherbaspirillum humi]|uniref:Uncharacterized protein n=1 Tax=Noviherbaspirillum humi TaxID=1688639 RepID=A0A239ITN7_9BURK|nr:hypothetical protein [Noviherbaspirillum humi]SNS96905.1 hypothetical protein SAMN06265795_110117 [Noviherbaspirillum humi]
MPLTDSLRALCERLAKCVGVVAAAGLLLAGCGGGVVDVAFVFGDPWPVFSRPLYERLQRPVIAGLQFVNSARPDDRDLTGADGTYFGYGGGDVVTFLVGDLVLFALPGDLPRDFTSLYEAARYQVSPLTSDTAAENLAAFLITLDDDGNAGNGIQIPARVRSAANGIRINFNQTSAAFYADPAVQFAVSVLSANTAAGQRALPPRATAVAILQ